MGLVTFLSGKMDNMHKWLKDFYVRQDFCELTFLEIHDL